MALLSKLTGKLAKKTLKKIGGTSRFIKTSSQTIGSKIPSIAGGKTVRKTVARATAKTGMGAGARIAGKAIIPAGIIGGLALGGTRIYDYVGDVRAKTPDLRAYEYGLSLADQEIDLLDRAREQAKGLPGASSADMAIGGQLADYLPIMGTVKEKGKEKIKQEITPLLFGAVGIAIIGGGLYYLNKKKTSKSKAKK